MKTGIGCYYITRYGADAGAARMAEHGYSYLDLDLSNTESKYYTAKEDFFFSVIGELKKKLSANGIGISQVHGPWRFPPKDATEEDRAERFGKMTKAAAIARFMGAKYLIVHPLMPFGVDEPTSPDEVYEINKRFFTSLSDVSGKLGVTVCLENMPFREFPLSSSADILKLIREINSPHLAFCFDTGHANYYGEDASASIIDAGELLAVLHVHDNFGDTDAHLPPYDGNIDWAAFAEALYSIGYSGVMNIESSPKKIQGFDKMSEKEIEEAELSLAKIAKLLAGE